MNAPLLKTFFFSSIFVFLTTFASAQATSCPCCDSTYRQFDFWLGNWEVKNEKGNIIGTNKIVKMQNGCLLQENWEGTSPGNAGTSYNFYDRTKKHWQQIWISETGYVLELSGGMIGNAMIMNSMTVPNNKGDSVFNKITWQPLSNGTVKQTWEVRNLNDSQWESIFVGVYVKKD